MLNSEILTAIYNIETEISEHKEKLFDIKKDLVHIDYRILQAQNKHTHGYIPTMVNIRKYFLYRQKIYQDLLDNALKTVSELRKKILSC